MVIVVVWATLLFLGCGLLSGGNVASFIVWPSALSRLRAPPI